MRLHQLAYSVCLAVAACASPALAADALENQFPEGTTYRGDCPNANISTAVLNTGEVRRCEVIIRHAADSPQLNQTFNFYWGNNAPAPGYVPGVVSRNPAYSAPGYGQPTYSYELAPSQLDPPSNLPFSAANIYAVCSERYGFSYTREEAEAAYLKFKRPPGYAGLYSDMQENYLAWDVYQNWVTLNEYRVACWKMKTGS